MPVASLTNLHQAGALLTRIREQKPLIQHLTNYVVMNDTANATLQVGASPVMAHENADMLQFAKSLVLNMGTLDDAWLERMVAIGRVANELGVPIVFDPVGAGATRYRTGRHRARHLSNVLTRNARCSAQNTSRVTG